MMEECNNMIRRDINVDETEINQDDLDGFIEEFPDITSPAMMEISGNEDNTNEEKNRSICIRGGKIYRLHKLICHTQQYE